MVEVGTNIQARVVRIEAYGIWLKYAEEDVLVLVPEVSWKSVSRPEELVKIGDVRELRVLRYNYKDHVIVGSFKALHPEENPYRKLSRLEPGTILLGKVSMVLDDAVKVDLPDSVYGTIPRSRALEVSRGDTVEVKI